jgi:hypothetical protein
MSLFVMNDNVKRVAFLELVWQVGNGMNIILP